MNAMDTDIPKKDKIAIFLDAENLTEWITNNGVEKLISELSAIGQCIVRRAYGKWGSNTKLQEILNKQGFEFIHTFHPVSGKNSADIQLIVDAMEYATQIEELHWFALATGDSDFSPLFRRLREIGKEVIGVGPQSPLSDSVKTSCSRFIYTDNKEKEKIKNSSKKTNNQALPKKYIDLVEQTLKHFDEDLIHCSKLKNAILNIDSAFNEKTIGFKSFTTFLKKIPSLKVDYNKETNVYVVGFRPSK